MISTAPLPHLQGDCKTRLCSAVHLLFSRVNLRRRHYTGTCPQAPSRETVFNRKAEKRGCTPAAQSGGKAARNCIPDFFPALHFPISGSLWQVAAHARNGIVEVLRDDVKTAAVRDDNACKGGKTLSDQTALFVFDCFLGFPGKQAELFDRAGKLFPEGMRRAAGAVGIIVNGRYLSFTNHRECASVSAGASSKADSEITVATSG